MVQIVAITVIK